MKNKLINVGFMVLFTVAAVVLVLYGVKMFDENSTDRVATRETLALKSMQKGLMTKLPRQAAVGEQKIGSETTLAKPAEKLIKTADVRFQVRNLTKSRSTIEQLVKTNGGYIASDEQRNEEHQIENILMIRLPAARFDLFLRALKGQALYLDSQTIEVKDVTAEFIDNEARLNAKRKLEQRYAEILRKAGSVKEILEVEARLGTIREEIEAVEGQLKYLQDQVSYSTVTLKLYQPMPHALRPDRYFGKQLSQALVNGWKGFLTASVALASVWPLVILLAVIGLVIRRNRLRHLNQG
ncbi:MAG TPA: DUF4349 domain-containing protein [Bacillota bacterium]|nr:DUF4349 domain-containing protein [Bacillota bacterium]